jgi:hypothetical protein
MQMPAQWICANINHETINALGKYQVVVIQRKRHFIAFTWIMWLTILKFYSTLENQYESTVNRRGKKIKPALII